MTVLFLYKDVFQYIWSSGPGDSHTDQE